MKDQRQRMDPDSSQDLLTSADLKLDAILRQLATPIEHPMPKPGELVGDADRYKLGEKLGRGGQGAVYKAWDSKLGRQVAIKFVMPGEDDSPETWEKRCRRFDGEVDMLARIQHDNIVTTFDRGRWQDLPFLVMALLTGDTLRGLLHRERRLSPMRTLHIVRQIATGLEAAHGASVIHRDLKPENIFIEADDRVRVLDFGMARLTTPTRESLSRSGSLFGGTERYMAPEQWRGHTQQDERTDVWALGIILFEMLVGKHPFPNNPAALIEHVMMPLPALEALDKHRHIIPKGLQGIIAKALNGDAAERYPSMGAIGASLARVERRLDREGGFHETPEPEAPSEGRRSSAPWRKLIWAISAMALVVSLVSITEVYSDQLAYTDQMLRTSLTLGDSGFKACVPESDVFEGCLLMSTNNPEGVLPFRVTIMLWMP